MSISKKKIDKLYDSVHTDIMNARIRIVSILGDHIDKDKVDNILSGLCASAPQNAINILKPHNQ